MTGPAAVLAHAVRSGLVEAGQALAGRVGVTAIGASNLVHRIDLDGSAVAFVKATGPAAALDGDDSVAREVHVLGLLRDGSAVPTVLPITTPAELWLGPVEGTSIAELAGGQDVAATSDAFAALGTALASLHRTPVAAEAPVLRLPWPLLDDLPAHMETARYHRVPTLVIETARQLPDVTTHVRSRWRAITWVHGDVSPMNAIVGADGAARLIDWEGAGVGDPSWDLAGALLMTHLAAPGWEPVAAARLLHAYRTGGGPGAEPDPALSCVRTLVAAYQQAVGAFALGGVPDADGQVTRLLDEAMALAEAHRAGGRHVQH